ncbi:hypothetical protein MAR_038098 [Mya arenaria]|uniref:Uncharacterized protein n=1 Tax=Mya arenaria TaxID=6604 RepID=A0ABY7FTG8_MYAAR|nr:hypothetical protein MAR_038098 [Mya arenaria]
MQMSGKVLITTDLGDHYGSSDDDGHKPINIRRITVCGYLSHLGIPGCRIWFQNPVMAYLNYVIASSLPRTAAPVSQSLCLIIWIVQT